MVVAILVCVCDRWIELSRPKFISICMEVNYIMLCITVLLNWFKYLHLVFDYIVSLLF